MKKLLAAIIVLFTLTTGAPLIHAATSCDTVDQGNYTFCCLETSQGGVDQCDAYAKSLNAQQSTTTSTTTSTNSCIPVTANNFGVCCEQNTTTSATQAAACRDYYSSGAPTTAQQVGGSQSTTAVHSTTTTSYAGNPSLNPSAGDQQAVQACSAIAFKTLLDVAIWAKCLIGAIVIPGIFTLAFVVFLWGVFKFIRASEQKDKDEGKQFIWMGLIGLFVMVSVWGIIRILNTTLGIDSTVPTLQTDYLDPSKANKK